MKNNGLDERQEQAVARIGTTSFYVMFCVCAVTIVVELFLTGSLKSVAGETVVLLAGGIPCMVGYMKNGLWSRHSRPLGRGQNLLLSIVFSGIFSVIYAAFLCRGNLRDGQAAVGAAGFFVGVAVLCFVCLGIMGRIAEKNQEKEEQKYRD